MKHYPLLICLVVCSLVSCDSTVSGSPEATLTGFIECMNKQDFQGAKAYTNPSTDAILDFLDTRIKLLEEMGKMDEIATIFGGIDFHAVSVNCTTKEKTSICTVCETKSNNCSDILVEQTLGKWLINMPKESPSPN